MLDTILAELRTRGLLKTKNEFHRKWLFKQTNYMQSNVKDGSTINVLFALYTNLQAAGQHDLGVKVWAEMVRKVGEMKHAQEMRDQTTVETIKGVQ